MSKSINVEERFKNFLLNQKRLKKKLEEFDKRYKLITENANDFIAILDNNLQYGYINEEFHRKYLGYSKEQLIGLKVDTLIHPDDVEQATKSYKKINETGEGKVELRVKHNDGYYIWVESKGKRFIDVNGEQKLLLISRDITERKEFENKLKESEEKFRTITEHSNLGIVIFQNEQFKYTNQTMSKINGYSSEEMLNWSMKDMAKLIHPEDLPIVLEQLKNNISGKGKDFFRNIYQIITKSGKLKSIEVWANKIIYEGKDAFLISAIDVSEKIEMQNRIKESEEQYRLISESANDLIRVLNDRFEFEYINEGVHKRLLGYESEDLIGKTHYPFFHPEDRKNIIRTAFRNLRRGEGSYQTRFKDKNGKYRWFEISAKYFYDSKGKKKILSIARNIHERKITELKLKESEERYRLISENANDLIRVLDDKFEFEYINEGVHKRVLGYEKEDLIGKTHLPFLHPDDKRIAIRSTLRNLKKGEGSYQARFKAKDGSYRWFEFAGKYFYDSKGQKKILSIARDINERKIAELRLRESEKKYRRAYNRARFYKDLFTHDMNNILAIITSSSELIPFYLTESQKSNDIKSLITVVKNQVDRGAKLISNVNTLSELEEEEIKIESTEASKLLRSSIDLIKKSYNNGKIKINISCSEKQVIVNANELLQDVFDNILINATKYNENKNLEICIKISKMQENSKKYYKFEFIDNGIGVSDDRKEIIFNRGNRELKGTKGMGIGLSLVKKIIKIYGGKIWVEDRVVGDYSRGSNFILIIPETNF